MFENLEFFDEYSTEAQASALSELVEVRPKFIEYLIEDIAYFTESGIDYLQSIPNLIHFI